MPADIRRLRTAQGHPLWVCTFPPCRSLVRSFVFLITDDSLQHALLLSAAGDASLDDTCRRIQAASSLQGILFAPRVLPLKAVVKVQRVRHRAGLELVYEQGGRQKKAKVAHPVADVYPELFQELCARAGPSAGVLEEPLTWWEAAGTPLLVALACLVFGGFLFLASLNMDDRQTELYRSNRREYGLARVLNFLGPTGTAAVVLLLLAACAVWATLRIVKRLTKDVVYFNRS
jgi:hypothetical protein